MKNEIISKCICGKYHCPVCYNQMEVYNDDTHKVFYASEFKRLEEEIKNLRCCGNCNLYSDGWCNTNQNEVYGDDLCPHYFAASREVKMNIEHSVDADELIDKLAAADAEIKRLEAEIERLTDAMSFTESKALDRVAELEGKLKNLRCCGNCTYFYDNVCSKFPTIDGEYCDKWEDDTLTQEDRK